MKTLRAAGTIPTAVFVTQDSAGDNSVLKAGVDTFPVGISGFGGKYAPIPSVTTDPPIHAEIGDPCQYHSPFSGDPQDSTAMLRIGATVTAGQRLMPNSDGEGIPATTGKYFGAIADVGGVDGNIITVTPASGLVA